jgi:hypothetical protein
MGDKDGCPHGAKCFIDGVASEKGIIFDDGIGESRDGKKTHDNCEV